MYNKDKQSRSDRFTPVREALESLPVPDENQIDWDKVEGSVFDALDKKPSPVLRFPVWQTLSLAASLLLLITGVFLYSSTTKRSDRIIFFVVNVSGRLLIDADRKGAAADTFGEHHSIRTESSSTAMVKSATGLEEVTLYENTIVNLQRLRRHDQQVSLSQGTIEVSLAKVKEHRRFCVTTPNAHCEALGTIFKVGVFPDGVAARTVVAVLRGAVKVTNTDSSEFLIVKAPDAAIVENGHVTAVDKPSIAEPQQPEVALRTPSTAFTNENTRTGEDTPMINTIQAVDTSEPRIQAVGEPVLDQLSKSAPASTIVSALDKVVSVVTNALPGAKQRPERSRAGMLCGITFFWEDELNEFDTLNWRSMLVCSGLDTLLPGNAPERAAADAASIHGKAFFRLVNPTAMAIAMLIKGGYHVVSLDRWSGYINFKTGEEAQQQRNIVTDYLWECIDSVSIESLGKVGGDYRIFCHFDTFGKSDYKGRQKVYLSRSPIGGTLGFALHDMNLIEKGRAVPEDNMHRLVLDVYVIGPASAEPRDIVRAIEKQMDAYKLDLTYKIPEIRNVGLQQNPR